MRVGSATFIVHTSAQIDPGTIIDSDVNAAAAIEFSKLNSAAVNAALIPDVHNTRALGSPTHNFDGVYFQNLYAVNCAAVFRPNTDNTLALGAGSRNWTEIFVHKISGNAAGQIMVNGLLGGIA